MEREKMILEEVEKTLNSIDNIAKLETNPFLFTRIKARIVDNSVEQIKEGKTGFVLKPVALIIILVINIVTAVFFFNNNSTNQAVNTNTTLVESLTEDYKYSQTEYENFTLE
jgi:hypothetical protein